MQNDKFTAKKTAWLERKNNVLSYKRTQHNIFIIRNIIFIEEYYVSKNIVGKLSEYCRNFSDEYCLRKCSMETPMFSCLYDY